MLGLKPCLDWTFAFPGSERGLIQYSKADWGGKCWCCCCCSLLCLSIQSVYSYPSLRSFISSLKDLQLTAEVQLYFTLMAFLDQLQGSSLSTVQGTGERFTGTELPWQVRWLPKRPIYFFLSDELLHYKRERSPWQTGWCTSAGVSLPTSRSAPLILGAFEPCLQSEVHLSSYRFTSTPVFPFFPNCACFPQISLPSHMYKHQPPAPNSSHGRCFGDQRLREVLAPIL